MEKIFTLTEVLEETKVNIRTFYLIGEPNMWWSNVKDRLVWPKFICSKFQNELIVKFYLVTIQR